MIEDVVIEDVVVRYHWSGGKNGLRGLSDRS